MPEASRLSLKIVIRCADIGRSKMFYEILLGLPVLEEWDEAQGCGCIFGFGDQGHGGRLELYEMRDTVARFDEAFRRPVQNDKIDIQLSTPSLEPWIQRLAGKWDHDEPETMPWGHTSMKMRDPDGVMVVIVEESEGEGAGEMGKKGHG